jgi:hypothetical protein
MSKKPLIVYWAPHSGDPLVDKENWNLMYPEPTNLFSELHANKTKESTSFSWFSCPAVSNRLKHTFVFRNNVRTKVHWDITDAENPVLEIEEYGIYTNFPRPPAMYGTTQLYLFLGWLFFCEEPVIAQLQTPYMHKPGYTNSGVIVPGQYDISSWFRKVNAEMLMWEESGTMTIEDDEPLIYLELMTDRPVILKRFTVSPTLAQYDKACVEAPSFFGRNLPLPARYKRFRETRMNELVLNEIKKNLVSE